MVDIRPVLAASVTPVSVSVAEYGFSYSALTVSNQLSWRYCFT